LISTAGLRAETYRGRPNLSALLTELSCTNNLMILGKGKREEEREFYLRLAAAQEWPSRELERQINNALFERTVLSPARLSAPLRELHQGLRRGMESIQMGVRFGSKLLMAAGHSRMTSAPAALMATETGSTSEGDFCPWFFTLGGSD
jgi:hypothetical protein